MTQIEKDIYKTSGGFYYSCGDYPWPSARTKQLLEIANDKFNEIKDHGMFVRLIISNHWATQGYWVETEKTKVEGMDIILKEYQP